MPAEPDAPIGLLELSLAAAWACPLSGVASLLLLRVAGPRELAALHRTIDPLAAAGDGWAALPCLGALVAASFLLALAAGRRRGPELHRGEGCLVFAAGALSALLWPFVLLGCFVG